VSAAYNPTAEPTSATSAMETLNNPLMQPPLILRLFTGSDFSHARRNPTAAGRTDLPRRTPSSTAAAALNDKKLRRANIAAAVGRSSGPFGGAHQ